MGKLKDKTDTYKYNLLIALEKTLGNVKKSCEMCKIHPSTYYKYLKEDQEFANNVKELDEDRIDFVESKMFQRINGYTHKETKVFNHKGVIITKTIDKHYPPDSGLIQFFLETKAKDRGYVRKTIHENKEYDPFEGKTEAEIDQMILDIELEERREAEKIRGFKKLDNDSEPK